MHRINLGEFEELILLLVGVLHDEAYGVAILEELEKQTSRKVNISAVHSALRRLEKKGFVTSRMGGATAVRGGRRKRLFKLTGAGAKVLAQVRELRNNLWQQIPKIAFL
jgi:PadR family transcriptional regulator PadR